MRVLPTVIPTCIFLIMISCYEGNDGTMATSGNEDRFQLVVTDTIGVDLGDSNYVFGAVSDAAFFRDGRIALVDPMKKKISVFSARGTYLYSVGSVGSGPGEFMEPSSIDTYPDGSCAVTAPTAGKVVIYDSASCFRREITWPYNCPYQVCAGEDDRLIGMQFDYYAEGDAMYAGIRLCAWSLATDPEIVLRSGYVLAEGMSAELPSYAYDTTSEGMLVSAFLSEEVYDLMMQDTDGDTLFHIHEDVGRHGKTEEELVIEHMPYRSNSAGFTDSEIRSMMDRWEPKPYRLAVSNVCVDKLDRIWVMSGVRDDPSPLFQIYDLEGSLLGSVQTDLGAEANNWTFVFGDSTALAFDSNPDDYSKVFVISIREN